MISRRINIGRLLIGAFAGALFVFASFAVADAADRRVRIINETSFDIVRFYGSNIGTDNWLENILGRDILRPGRSITIDFNDGSGYCFFDFKAVFDDGDDIVKERVNVCKIGSFRVTQ